MKRFHNTLALERREYDAANPAYSPASPEHELCLGFANEADRTKFGNLVLQPMRALAGPSDASAVPALEEWANLPALPDHAQIDAAVAAAGGGGGVGSSSTDGLGGEGGQPLTEEQLLEIEDRRRAERLEDDEDDPTMGMPAIEDFEVDPSKVKQVKARCRALKWPLLEEYDFRNDTSNPEVRGGGEAAEAAAEEEAEEAAVAACGAVVDTVGAAGAAGTWHAAWQCCSRDAWLFA